MNRLINRPCDFDCSDFEFEKARHSLESLGGKHSITCLRCQRTQDLTEEEYFEISKLPTIPMPLVVIADGFYFGGRKIRHFYYFWRKKLGIKYFWCQKCGDQQVSKKALFCKECIQDLTSTEDLSREGFALDNNERLLVGIAVRATSRDGNLISSTVTNEEGHFSIDIPTGTRFPVHYASVKGARLFSGHKPENSPFYEMNFEYAKNLEKDNNPEALRRRYYPDSPQTKPTLL